MYLLRSAVVAALALTLSTASPALAQKRTTRDGMRDVWSVDGDNSYVAYDGSRVNVDVVRSTVRHSPKRVTARIRYVDLVRNTDRATASVRMLTSGKRTYLLQLTAGPGDRTGRVLLAHYSDHGWNDVQCGGMRKSVQYRRDVLVASVPRRCLGRPTWVRYTGEATAIEEGPGTSYTDALLSGDPVNDLYSRRIRRG